MDHTFCPGSKLLRHPKPESIMCPRCRAEVEIWSDEMRATCPSCKQYVMRETFGSCLDWCKMGKECVGAEIFDRYMVQRTGRIKNDILQQMERLSGNDETRIAHARKVLQYAEDLLQKENGDWNIVVPAAILNDLGAAVAVAKAGSAVGTLQEKDASSSARKILLKVGIQADAIDEICDIIGNHHSPEKITTSNCLILHDADCLANLEELMVRGMDQQKRRSFIDRTFLTVSGRAAAEAISITGEHRE